jgi:hypothetical protein
MQNNSRICGALFGQFGLWLSLVERLVREKFTTLGSILLRYVSADIYVRPNALHVQKRCAERSAGSPNELLGAEMLAVLSCQRATNLNSGQICAIAGASAAGHKRGPLPIGST